MSHYFSLVRLLGSPRHDAWLRDLSRHGEAYRDHAVIWRLFPGDGAARDFVFRRLEDKKSFYVVSARPPQADAGLFHIQSKAYSPELTEGEWVRFDLRANPTVSVRRESGRSQRHDVLMHAKQIASTEKSALPEQLEAAGRAWLQDRAKRWGLDLRTDSLMQNGYRQQRLKRKGKNIAFSTLDYQGLAQVADPEQLRRALLEGVGHSKGFGCGLLLVKRVD